MARICQENDARRRWFASFREDISASVFTVDIRYLPALATTGCLSVCFCRGEDDKLIYAAILYNTRVASKQIFHTEVIEGFSRWDSPRDIAAILARRMVDGNSVFSKQLTKHIIDKV